MMLNGGVMGPTGLDGVMSSPTHPCNLPPPPRETVTSMFF